MWWKWWPWRVPKVSQCGTPAHNLAFIVHPRLTLWRCSGSLTMKRNYEKVFHGQFLSTWALDTLRIDEKHLLAKPLMQEWPPLLRTSAPTRFQTLSQVIWRVIMCKSQMQELQQNLMGYPVCVNIYFLRRYNWSPAKPWLRELESGGETRPWWPATSSRGIRLRHAWLLQGSPPSTPSGRLTLVTGLFLAK